MGAQIQVRSCYKLSGVGVVFTGEVRHGEITDTMMGMTSDGKRCPIVKIELDNQQVSVVRIRDIATIVVKHVSINEIRTGAVIYFD